MTLRTKKLLQINFLLNSILTLCFLGYFAAIVKRKIKRRKITGNTNEFLILSQFSHIFNAIASIYIKEKMKYFIRGETHHIYKIVGGRGKAIETWIIIRELFYNRHIQLINIRTQYYKNVYNKLSMIDIFCVSGDNITLTRFRFI